jgi:uncharacterized protein involved in exopolysaccharide biosynthesis/protein involved in polysaccharide export with SLBB domain
VFRVIYPPGNPRCKGWLPLPNYPAAQADLSNGLTSRQPSAAPPASPSVSFRELYAVIARRRRFAAIFLASLLLACLLYCLIAPKQYDARARVSMRTTPAPTFGIETPEPAAATSILSAPLQLETLATVFRSDQLAWRVITGLKLYESPAFAGRFDREFPGFKSDSPSSDAQSWLLERFQQRLHVQTLPRTLIVEIRFRSKDAALSSQVVNALIGAYCQQDTDARVEATAQATEWLKNQLNALKTRVDQNNERLTSFQNEHGILVSPEASPGGEPAETQHSSALLEIDELGRQMVAATADRILREAEFRAASEGNPELVFASDPRLQGEGGALATAMLQQIHTRRSELEQEQAQLSLEHGPNFPRVVEVHRQLQDLDRQSQAEDAKLVERFRGALDTAQEREDMVRNSLDEHTAEALKRDQAATEYEIMRQEANSSHDVYLRVLGKVQEAGLVAGIRASTITVVDYALPHVKPVVPNLPLYLAITIFAGLWLALGGALMLESLRPAATRSAALLLAAMVFTSAAKTQPPTPSTSGLPSGVIHPSAPAEPKNPTNPNTAPDVWDQPAAANPAGGAATLELTPMPGPIGPGDSLDISEFHTPEFHSVVRVSPAGSVALPLIGEINLGGLDEAAAAQVIDAALLAKGMLLHPQVSVLVTAYVGQDVSVLGEVARPGVYAYTLHHRLLDLISAASGLAPAAGRLVNIFHRSDPKTPHPIILDPSAADTAGDHNPELLPGDTVQVSRAGLVYVIGDVVRPGGFPVDPAQGLTVVQALSLAWGPTPNALASKALLIREQKGGRTLTTLNLQHMLHGREPDQPIRDRDILFVPDSTAKALLNKSIDAAIQSVIGVSVYSGLVYSQRF